MQIKDVRPASFVKQIRCDRCDRLAEVGDAELEFQEFVSINQQAGYASIFGDGNHVQVDLCQHCLKDVLGRWLRIDDPRAKSLGPFDPDRHGGEFPNAADASRQEPDDVQVQVRMPLNEPPVPRRRLSSLQAFFGHSVRLYFAPLTGAVRGIRREYRRLEWAERQRLRRQAELARRGREAVKRSIAAGDWIPAWLERQDEITKASAESYRQARMQAEAEQAERDRTREIANQEMDRIAAERRRRESV